MSLFTRSKRLRTWLFLACLTEPLWHGLLVWWLAYHPWAVLNALGSLLLIADLVLVFLGFAALLILVGGLLVALTSAHRRVALVITGSSLVFLVSWIGGIRLGRVVWHLQVERVIARGEPLVMAIHDFESRNGRPPGTLGELTPEFIDVVPTTGIGPSGEFGYIRGEQRAYDGNPWVLVVCPPDHPNSFDRLMYFPLQNYPTEGYGGGVERIGAWGYVHE